MTTAKRRVSAVWAGMVICATVGCGAATFFAAWLLLGMVALQP